MGNAWETQEIERKPWDSNGKLSNSLAHKWTSRRSNGKPRTSKGTHLGNQEDNLRNPQETNGNPEGNHGNPEEKAL